MKKSRISAIFLSAFMLIGSFSVQSTSVLADTDNPEFAYFMNTAEDSAYVWLGEKIEGENLEFYDGQALGIKDNADPLYNETVTLDGLTARKQYNANTSYFKLNKDFYSDSDTEFLISLVFYDFGPSEGKFYFEYHALGGELKQITLVKPGTNPGWAVKTMLIEDMDLDTVYENGANFRIINGAYNAFKKLEVSNISKAKREKTPVMTTALGFDNKTELESLRIIKAGDSKFLNANLSKECNGTDANVLRNIITGKTNNNPYGSEKLTQGELAQMYMQALGLTKSEDEEWVDAIKRLGVIESKALFIYDDAPATNFNLINIVYGTLMYNNNGKCLLADLINNGFYDGVEIKTIKSENFQSIYFEQPKKLPYEKITNSLTGRTYMHINFFGQNFLRGYNDVQSWLPDGSGFICGTSQGHMYHYDIKTQMLTYLDKIKAASDMLCAYSCPNGWVYYQIVEGNKITLARINPKTHEKERLIELPEGLDCLYYNVTNDGRYATIEAYDKKYVLPRPANTTPVIRIDLDEKKLEYRWYSFSYGPNFVDHFQINPEYPDIIAFSHEQSSAEGFTAADITDRLNIMDFKTGEVVTYNSGVHLNGQSVQLVTHEAWGASGEYRYFSSWPTDTKYESGDVPAVVRVNKDGTHRQYFATNSGNSVHATASGDDKMICTDLYIRLISTETHQVFPIVSLSPIIGSKNHPYHPHPHLSYSGNMVSWGEEHDGVLGISFMDYTSILKNEVKKGGRYPFGDFVTRVSYKGLECESSVTTKAGKESVCVKPGKSAFFDINAEVIDTDNGAVKLTFDYYDNGNRPLVLTYTKGVEEINDAWKIYNRETEIKRENTRKWKTAEIVIDCGNFENIGKFETDFKISSTEESAYIANIRVEKVEN